MYFILMLCLFGVFGPKNPVRSRETLHTCTAQATDVRGSGVICLAAGDLEGHRRSPRSPRWQSMDRKKMAVINWFRFTSVTIVISIINHH